MPWMSTKPRVPKIERNLEPYGRELETQLYGLAQQGIGGRPWMPTSFGALRKAYTGSYQDARRNLEGYLNQTVAPADTKVREYMKQALGRGYLNVMQGISEEEQMEPYRQQEQAVTLGSALTASRRRLAVDYGDIMGQTAMQSASMPTFGETMGYGLGYAGNWAYLNYARKMAGGQ